MGRRSTSLPFSQSMMRRATRSWRSSREIGCEGYNFCARYQWVGGLGSMASATVPIHHTSLSKFDIRSNSGPDSSPLHEIAASLAILRSAVCPLPVLSTYRLHSATLPQASTVQPHAPTVHFCLCNMICNFHFPDSCNSVVWWLFFHYNSISRSNHLIDRYLADAVS